MDGKISENLGLNEKKIRLPFTFLDFEHPLTSIFTFPCHISIGNCIRKSVLFISF